MLQVFERQILQLRLERIQTQLMGERRIEVRRLLRHLVLRLLVRCVADETHDAHAVRDHDQDDAHILGKGQQEVTEIVALYDRVLVVEMLYLEEAVDDMLHRLAILGDDLLVVVDMARPEERGDDRLAAQPYLVDTDTCRLQRCHDGVEPKDIPVHTTGIDGPVQTAFQLHHVVLRHGIAYLLHQVPAKLPRFVHLFTGKNKRLFFHLYTINYYSTQSGPLSRHI